MSNDYFNASGAFTTGTKARGGDIETEFDAVATGLDKLPTEAQLKRGIINYGTDSGTANAYIVTLPYTPAALTDGQEVVFKALFTNTGASTINVNALGAKSLRRQNGTVISAGDITTNKITQCRYNATPDFFELLYAPVSGVSHNILAKIADYTVTSEDLLSNRTFTNTGASGTINLSLPAGATNHKMKFLVTVAQIFRITANGTETFRYSTTVGSAGGYIQSNAVGTCGTIIWSGTGWVITVLLGSLTIS